jgi:hypothetical protein
MSSRGSSQVSRRATVAAQWGRSGRLARCCGCRTTLAGCLFTSLEPCCYSGALLLFIAALHKRSPSVCAYLTAISSHRPCCGDDGSTHRPCRASRAKSPRTQSDAPADKTPSSVPSRGKPLNIGQGFEKCRDKLNRPDRPRG